MGRVHLLARFRARTGALKDHPTFPPLTVVFLRGHILVDMQKHICFVLAFWSGFMCTIQVLDAQDALPCSHKLYICLFRFGVLCLRHNYLYIYHSACCASGIATTFHLWLGLRDVLPWRTIICSYSGCLSFLACLRIPMESCITKTWILLVELLSLSFWKLSVPCCLS